MLLLRCDRHCGQFFTPYPGTPLILFSILAVILAIGALLKLWETNSILADAEENGTLDAIYDTYQNGLSLLGGTVRIGQEYILGQNCLVATKISDIEQVYEYIRRTNGAVSHHQLILCLTDGEKRVLCNLERHHDKQSVISVFAAIKLRKPDVKLGV